MEVSEECRRGGRVSSRATTVGGCSCQYFTTVDSSGEEISVWTESAAKNSDSLINNVKVAKADTVKMSVERYLVLARFEEHLLLAPCRHW